MSEGQSLTHLANKKVLITGAASGIGRLMAERVARFNGRLVLLDINQSRLNAFCKELADNGYTAYGYTCNLADKQDIQRCTQTILSRHGNIDVLINNAGVVAGKPLLENTDAEIELTFNVNVLAIFYLIRAFLPGMIAQQNGHIVNISSAAALCGASRLVAYSASKSALAGLDESLRFEFRRLGYPINTTVVFPYYMSTGMFSGVKSRFPWLLPILDPDKVAQRIIKAILKNQPRVVMPWFAYTAILSKVLPIAAFDALAEFFGINRSMDEFKGRSPN